MLYGYIMVVVCALNLQSITALFYGMPDYSTHQGSVVVTKRNEKMIHRCDYWLLCGM